MTGIKEILDWNYKPSHSKQLGKSVINADSKRHLKEIKEKLYKSIAGLPNGANIPKPAMIRDVFYLFQENKIKEYEEMKSLFNNRKARMLIWALDYKNGEFDEAILYSNDFSLALKLIKGNWKDSYIMSLWHVLLKNWNLLILDVRKKNQIVELVENKLAIYPGNRKNIIRIKKDFHLFKNIDGPILYARELINRNVEIDNANSIIGQNDSLISYDYFANVGIEYVNEISNQIKSIHTLESIHNFVLIHNDKKVTLLIFAELINSNVFVQYPEFIKIQSLELIGDPIKKNLWRNSGFSINEAEKVELARRKLNKVLNKRFIKFFFEKLVEDPRRKRYWLNYIDNIDDIYFVGNRTNYRLLKNVDSISKNVDARYKVTRSSSKTVSLIMYSKSYVFVEFSNIGSLYLYKKENFNVNLNKILSVDELKLRTHFELAVRKNYYRYYNSSPKYNTLPEGRLYHQIDWEERLNFWMHKYHD